MYIRDENELAQLLKQAAEAHHAFETALGHPDEAWPEWYAKHIAPPSSKPANKQPPPSQSDGNRFSAAHRIASDSNRI
jgi:hypothetical protein